MNQAPKYPGLSISPRSPGGKTSVIVCSFTSGLDEMKRKDQGDAVKVLQVLERTKRFSVFEATANNTLARTISNIMSRGYSVIIRESGERRDYGKLVERTGGAYPWVNIELTDGGKRLLSDTTSVVIK